LCWFDWLVLGWLAVFGGFDGFLKHSPSLVKQAKSLPAKAQPKHSDLKLLSNIVASWTYSFFGLFLLGTKNLLCVWEWWWSAG